MQFDNEFEVIRLLSGNTLKVFLVLLFARKQPGMGALAEDRIQALCDLSQNTVRKALAGLELVSLAQRNGDLWTLSSGALQLPLFAGLMDGVASQNLTRTAPETRMIDAPASQILTRAAPEGGVYSDNKQISEPVESIFDSENCSTTSSGSGSLNLLINNPPPLQDLRAARESKFDSRVIFELDRQGICEPQRSRLANMPHVTADLVRYHCETAPSTGAAIYRIAKHWRVSSSWTPTNRDGASPDDPGPDAWPEVDADDFTAWNAALEQLQEGLPGAFDEPWPDGLIELWAILPDRWIAGVWREHVAVRMAELGIPARLKQILGVPVDILMQPWKE